MPTYTLNPTVVRRSIDELDSLKLHPHFAAYLGLTRLAEETGTTQDLGFDTEAYYDQFFRVTMDGDRNMTIDGSEKEYLVPFTNPHARSIWRSDNQPQQVSPGTAGRSTANVGLNNVVDIDIDAATYTLLDRHWELAYDHLTYEEKVPAILVAVFLYRDYGFEADEPPAVDDLIELFRDEFGFADDERFDYLFIEDYDLGSTEVFKEHDD